MYKDRPRMPPMGPWLARAASLALGMLCHPCVAATAQSAPAAPSSAAVPSPAAAAASSIAPPMSAAEVLQTLDQAIDWYRTLGIQQQAANEPSDMLFLYDNRQTAAKVMTQAFDIARADADMLKKVDPPSQDQATDSGMSAQAMAQYKTNLDAQLASVQTELDAEHRALAASGGAARAKAAAKLNELKGELDLITTKQSILASMAEVIGSSTGSNADSLKAQIDAMAVAIPSSVSAVPTTAPAPGAAAPVSTASAAATAGLLAGTAALPATTVGRFGLWDLAANAIRLSAKAGTITEVDRRTVLLQNTMEAIRTPLVVEIKALSARGDALAAKAAGADSVTLNGVHDQLDGLAVEFKQVSALLLPLGLERVLLGQYRRNLHNWRDSVDDQYRQALKTLAIRLGVVIAILAVLFTAADLWRRTVLRYIQDSRRRYQLLLLRRIALWSLVVIVIGVAFASELSSIVTFAGLITAGIAVAMQSVLVSIVGYFFLIGKYGIRVGDRVQIGEVAGEVIDLGLVRMYLMELGGKGTLGPTGRVVAFANSVVFQVASGLFKQIPGVYVSWREVVLKLPEGGDYVAVKEQLLAAVTLALTDYHDEILRQTREIQRTTLSDSAAEAHPRIQLQYAANGVEAHVRYPVNLRHAAEIDERVTEALSRVVSTVPAG
jgi:small-conductance mechanosensitive channel